MLRKTGVKIAHSLRYSIAAWIAILCSSVALAEDIHQGDLSDNDFDFCKWTEDGEQGRPGPSQIKDGFNATGYISLVACNPQPNETTTDGSEKLAGNYTRWIVEPANVSFNDGQRDYSIEGRRWYSRLFTDRVIDTAHFLEITMAAPDVVFSIPLSTFKYNEEGENGIEYTTNFRQHAFNQTYFRVDTNTTSNIIARGRHSFKTSFSGATDALNAVQSVVQLVVPSSTLLTSINADQVTTTSNAINTVASSLFSNRYDETVEDGFSLSGWHADRKVLVIVQVPFEVTSHRRNPNSRPNKKNAIYLAYWLSLSCPRASIFDTRDLCGNGQEFVASTGSILNFQIAANKTVQQHLGDQQWYKDFLTSPILTEDPTDKSADARGLLNERFCRSIENEFFSIGFNRGDTTRIVRAAIIGMPELSPVTRELTLSCATDDFDAFEQQRLEFVR